MFLFACGGEPNTCLGKGGGAPHTFLEKGGDKPHTCLEKGGGEPNTCLENGGNKTETPQDEHNKRTQDRLELRKKTQNKADHKHHNTPPLLGLLLHATILPSILF